MSIVVILALFVTFVADTFQRQEGVQSLREDGLLTLIAIAYGRLEKFIILTRYSKQKRENVKNLFCKELYLLDEDDGSEIFADTVSPTTESFEN